MYEEIMSQLKEIMTEELGIDAGEITPQSVLVNDLDVNSLEFMNVIMVAEEKFDVFLDENRLRDIKNVDDVVNYIIELKS